MVLGLERHELRITMRHMTLRINTLVFDKEGSDTPISLNVVRSSSGRTKPTPTHPAALKMNDSNKQVLPLVGH